MSIQSSINQMLSSIANQQLYKGLTKGIENIKTEVGNVRTEVSKTKKAIRKQTKSQAAGAYKQNQALAALMTQNKEAPQSTPDNASKSENIPWTVGEAGLYQTPQSTELSAEDYVDKSIDPNELQQISETILEHGSIKDLVEDARYGRQMIDDEIKLRKEYPDFDDAAEKLLKDLSKKTAQTRVNMARILTEDNREDITQRLQKAKAERSQAKQEFLKNKGGKHR